MVFLSQRQATIIFSIEVQLAEGEMKFMLDKSGFSADKPYFFAPEENTVINETGVAKDATCLWY